jgi:RimJ/RimL family protein N-acetyltransferase
MSQVVATPVSADEVLAMREEHRRQMNSQIVHDSIHTRRGWAITYLLSVGGIAAAFGSVAIAGPWKDKPTIFEFHVRPEHRARAFDLFVALVTAGAARFMEVQSNDRLLAVMLHTYAHDLWTEKIVFHDEIKTALPSMGAELQTLTSEEDIRQAIADRQGGPECRLILDGETVASGGILFHYNRPYGDIFMEVVEAYRGRGFGSHLVQELKRLAYELDSIPCARCSPDNIASRRTLQKAGFVPFANIVNGTLR